MLPRSLLGTSMLWLLLPGCVTQDPKSQDETASSESQGETSVEPQGEPMYCPGTIEWGYPVCRVQEDCEGFDYCVPAPDDCPGPGCPGDCEFDADCIDWGGPGINGVCTFPYTGCCASSGACAPPCAETGCATDETCELDGHCVAIACDDGFECTEGFSCVPGGAGADRHGCVLIPCDEAGALPCAQTSECVASVCQRIACSVDTDCPCGTCVQQECWERPWVCDSGNA